jgi:hypothetical protein
MSSPIARRLTAVLTLVAALWLAAPMTADAATRPTVNKPRVTLGSTFLDQVVAWVLDFWTAPAQASQSRQKTGTGTGTVLTGGQSPNAATAVELDRGAMIDPNGGS